MEIKEECLAYLGQYYKELFFGTANKRYRSMTCLLYTSDAAP